MYEKFFQFVRSPFNLTPDPHFFFFSKHHEEAFSQIIYGIQERKGFILITGEVGTGKTTLCRLLLEHLDPKVKTALIFNPSLTPIELLQAINQDFGISDKSNTKKALIDQLNRYLLDSRSRGENAVVIIDESQNLSVECLEEIRMLSNLETTSEKLLQLILVGQPELKQNLGLSQVRQLNQRISLRYHLRPLDLEMTGKYINFRLRVAGGVDQVHFTPASMKYIYEHSHGTPRLINIICDKALLAAYVAESRVITPTLVKSGLADVEPIFSNKRSIWPSDKRLWSLRSALIAGGILAMLLGIGVFWWGSGEGLRPPVISTEFNQAFSQEVSKVSASSPEPLSDSSQQVIADIPDISFARPNTLETKIPESVRPAAVVATYAFDSDGVFRVNDPQESERAAYLTVARLWLAASGQEVAMTAEEFKKADVGRLLEEWKLYQYPLPEDYGNILSLAYPAMVWLHTGAGGKPRPVVLSYAAPDRLTLLDPLGGRMLLSPEKFEERFTGRGILLWREIPGIALPLAWETPDISVRTLQAILKVWGLYSGLVDGIFGPLTESAIKSFQQERGLEPTGKVGMETYLVLAQAAMNDQIPTLRQER
jgi:general secretion pathway protein A